MIKNYLKIAFRNLERNKFYSFLNIIGLAAGICVFMLIAQYVVFERSYESFIPDRANIYRVSLQSYRSNQLILATAQNYPGVGPEMKNEIPEVINYARLLNMGYRNNIVITNENAKPNPIAFNQRKFLYADASFLSMMSYQMAAGNASSALAMPNTAVISEKYAKMYFGKEDAIGKTLRLQDDDLNDQLVTVTGVFKNLPSNTHLKFDVLFSYKTLFSDDKSRQRFDQNWTRENMFTYIRLRPGTDPKIVEGKLAAITNKYRTPLNQGNEKQRLSLQSLSDIHLYSDLAEEPEPNGSANTVFFISLIGIFVLMIAWINYVNLATARSISRAKEIGVRKVAGAFKHQLIFQFLTEAALINLLSLVIAYAMVVFILPYFNTISGLSLNISYLTKSWYIGLLFIIWLIGSLLSGFYPAWVLSSFKPVVVLKGQLKNATSGILLRKGLVVTQFMASVALIAGTFIVYAQLDFMRNRNIGMNINQVLVIARPGLTPGGRGDSAYNAAIDVFRNELKSSPAIEAVSTSMTIPGKQREYKETIRNTGTSSGGIIVRTNSMDNDFLNVFKMRLVAGRNFSKDYPRDPETSIIITESAAHLLGYTKTGDAIGKSVTLVDDRGKNRIIVGVVNDYHQVSLKKHLEPGMFYCALYGGGYYSVRININHLSQTILHVQQSWAKAFPGNPFEYFFLDDYFNQQYSNEQKFGKLFTTFAIFAIIISCLGLFGLSAFTATQRVKEIGIRKVLGASVINITAMLSKDFLKLVIIAVAIASPVAWLVMDKWLQDFAYHINISLWTFICAGLGAMFIALVTVSFQAIKAAIMNPVKSLRSE
ncbi:MAG: transporter permease [Chitinophagaceae bacterium]|nr:transporter permease [Chitinophagaceae bacterium]